MRPEQITQLVRETGALDRASATARGYVARAKEALMELPDTEYRRALLAVPDFILERAAPTRAAQSSYFDFFFTTTMFWM